MIVVYDIETLTNLFTYTDVNINTGEVFCEYIWDNNENPNDRLNHIKSLKNHIIKNVKGQIGYNNLEFDYPVLHFILNQPIEDITAALIYEKAQSVIKTKWNSVSNPLIPQLDLFKLWHFDNAAKMTSLKKLQITLGWENVADMPYEHTKVITEQSEVQEILDYNLNDVLSTKAFYDVSKPKIELRKGLKSKYGLECLNYSDSKIGEELLLKLYCGATDNKESYIRKLRTPRKEFDFKDCIPSYVKFTTPEFNQLLDYLCGIKVTELKDSFKYSFTYSDFTYELGTGGIHGCIEAGVYQSNEELIIVDADVSSLYPSIAISNKFYPKHLGDAFVEVYEKGIVLPRLEAKKNGDKVLADGFKLSANSAYGKSNSEYSWLYDPLYTLKTTITGQLSLCMLSEMLVNRVKNLTMLQINTDGLTVIIPKSEKRNYWNICKEWEQITKLNLEYVAYSKMVIRDVNNYLAVADGKIKRKGGAFRLNEEIIKDGEYHKPLNQGVVQLAISKYFLEGVAVEDTIKSCTDILMFTKTFSATHGWKCELFEEEETYEQQKTNRYIVTTIGLGFRKCKDDRIIEIEAGKKVMILNKLTDKTTDSYPIDYDYYIEEAYKVIHRVDGTEKRELEQKQRERAEQKAKKEEENFIKYCVDKQPTQRQYDMYAKEWLIDKYGQPTIKTTTTTK